ncbi:hypothetical protein PHYBOEH_011704 [Phytophthora boehmeriae]|uniref:RxLR effector protein n=1 Tax=Phytophthora boehmeriae TaxID=109152 RepID=A0A8T1VFD2_9STRA|nr:hypothetical protein PHYBOEH_011704 [Phytophthora boehmeriae]
MGGYRVLLMAVATLLVSCNAVSTATSLVQTGDSAPTTSHRFLRSHDAAYKDEDETTANDEERVGVTGIRKALGLYRTRLNPDTFSAMLKNDALKAKMFKTWDKFNVPLERITNKMFLELNPRFSALLDDYIAYRQAKTAVLDKVDDVVKKAEGVVKPKKKVTWNLAANKEHEPPAAVVVDDVANLANDVAAAT